MYYSMDIRDMKPEEAAETAALIEACFGRFIAPAYSEAGRQVFRAYAAEAALLDRLGNNHFTLVAEICGEIAGMLEMHGCSHVSLLFVNEHYHRRGIAKALLAEAIARCREQNPTLEKIDLNASPYAVGIYQRLGFKALGPEEERDGLRFTHMEKLL